MHAVLCMHYASYLDDPRPGLPIPLWILIAAVLLSAGLAAIEMAQAHVVRPVHPLAEPITVPHT